MRFAAVFSIIVGLGMVAQWGLSFLSRQIPELESEPIRIGFHIAAEMVTAILLLIGGTGLLAGAPWSRDISLLGMGMLFYTAIVSPGYFAQKGQWGWLGVFAAIIILGLVSIRLMW